MRYGQFVHQVMAANYPNGQSHCLHRLSVKMRKSGYISNCMRGHTVGKLMFGWIRNCNRQEFEVYCYYTEPKADSFNSAIPAL